MKIQSLIVYLLTSLTGLGLSYQVFAATAEELDQRELALARRIAQLEMININVGQYNALYDGSFYGTGGLVNQIEDFNRKTLDFVSKWAALTKLAEFSKQISGSNGIEAVSRIKVLLADRRSDLENLKAHADQIQNAILNVQSSLSLISQVSEENFRADGFLPFVAAYNKALLDFSQTLQQIKSYGPTRIAELMDLENRSGKIILENLRQVLIQQGVSNAQAVVSQAQDVLRVDSIGGKYLNRAHTLFGKVLLYDGYYLVAHAQETLVDLEKAVAAARVDLQSQVNIGSVAADYLGALDRIYRDAADRVKLLQSNTPSDNALFAQTLLQDYYKAHCEANNHKFNCSNLTTLTKINEQQFKKMTEQQLRDYEYLWERIGPLALTQ